MNQGQASPRPPVPAMTELQQFAILKATAEEGRRVYVKLQKERAYLQKIKKMTGEKIAVSQRPDDVEGLRNEKPPSHTNRLDSEVLTSALCNDRHAHDVSNTDYYRARVLSSNLSIHCGAHDVSNQDRARLRKEMTGNCAIGKMVVLLSPCLRSKGRETERKTLDHLGATSICNIVCRRPMNHEEENDAVTEVYSSPDDWFKRSNVATTHERGALDDNVIPKPGMERAIHHVRPERKEHAVPQRPGLKPVSYMEPLRCVCFSLSYNASNTRRDVTSLKAPPDVLCNQYELCTMCIP